MTVYWEGERGFVFDSGWGVDPPELYVLSADIWSEVMLDWLRGRRDEVVGRLTAMSGHRIVEDVNGYYRNSPDRRSVHR